MSADFYHATWQRSRKERRCCCFNAPSRKSGHRYRPCIIKPGERYVRIAQVFDGDFSVSVMCRKHTAIVDVALAGREYGEGIIYDEAREELEESMRGTGREGWFKMLHALRDEIRKSKSK